MNKCYINIVVTSSSTVMYPCNVHQFKYCTVSANLYVAAFGASAHEKDIHYIYLDENYFYYLSP